ncbi:MAG: ArnT family glycosyltransferase [Fusobacterium sp.]
MEKILDKKDLKNILILFPISIFAFFSNIWVRPADLMEARNFITAKEMIENDNFIVPTLNGFLRFEKPPLPTWFTAFVMKITGNFTDEWVLRIPAALTGIMFVFLYYFVKILIKNSRKSFITAFVGTTTFMLIKIGNENAWDIYPYVFAFGCITFLVKGFLTEKIKDFFIGGIFLAASFMSKGPVGIYGLIIPFFISYGLVFGTEKYKKNFKKIIFMILIGIILGNIWSITVYTNIRKYFYLL